MQNDDCRKQITDCDFLNFNNNRLQHNHLWKSVKSVGKFL